MAPKNSSTIPSASAAFETPFSERGGAVLAKGGILAAFAALVIGTYYEGTSHSEAFSAGGSFASYALTVLIAIGAYWFSLIVRNSKEASVSPAGILAIFLGHLFVFSFFFPFGSVSGGALTLFFKMVGYSALPAAIVLVTSAFGLWSVRKLFAGHADWSFETRTVAAIAGGLSSYLFVLSVAGSLFPYGFASAFLPLFAMGAIAWRELWGILSDAVRKRFAFSLQTTSDQTRFATAAFFFLSITFLLSVNLVNAMRPMPIGWDDLGAYMNFPKIIAMNGTIGNLGTVAWQTFTAIGFLFQSATQAFYLNQVGGFLSVIVLSLVVGRLLSAESGRKHFVHVPLMVSAAFVAMPMIVFQQAKDMKLDPALFALTVAAIFLVFEALRRKASYGRDAWKLFALGGFVAGIAFAVKFTTLMTFLGIFAVIAYAGLGLGGFFGFFALFVGVFTKFGLWSFLNVNYPKDDPSFLTTVSLVAFGLAGLML